jgi:hypothetical protein
VWLQGGQEANRGVADGIRVLHDMTPSEALSRRSQPSCTGFAVMLTPSASAVTVDAYVPHGAVFRRDLPEERQRSPT